MRNIAKRNVRNAMCRRNIAKRKLAERKLAERNVRAVPPANAPTGTWGTRARESAAGSDASGNKRGAVTPDAKVGLQRNGPR